MPNTVPEVVSVRSGGVWMHPTDAVCMENRSTHENSTTATPHVTRNEYRPNHLHMRNSDIRTV